MMVTEIPTLLPFAERIQSEGLGNLLCTVKDQSTLQINITKRCNLTCKHCHVVSGPERTEDMDRETLQACLDIFEAGPFVNLDITGGAPELNPHYRWFVCEAARIAAKKQECGLSTRVITRTNATILTDPSFADLPMLWATKGVEVAASLPHYEARKTEKMRGEGVFEQIIDGLKALNAVGYGSTLDTSPSDMPDSSETAAVDKKEQDPAPSSEQTPVLTLNIVVNPGGAILPGPQASVEREFRKALYERYGITFDNLLIITNNPVGRFGTFLESRNLLDTYLNKLSDAFNPATVQCAMCRDQISVDVDGRIFDCDFNQIVDLPILETCTDASYPLVNADGQLAQPLTVFDLQKNGLAIASPRYIRVENHCYACTAGAGSSCGGTTVE